MTKADAVKKIAGITGLTHQTTHDTIDAMVETMQEALNTDGKFTLQGFGTFTKVTKKARKGRNPKTGETIDIPEKQAVKFSPAQSLKDLVNA